MMRSEWCNSFLVLTIVLFLFGGCKSTTSAENEVLPKPLKALLDTTEHLLYYVPQYGDIDLVSGTRPDTLDSSILFCAEAAFTGVIADTFFHKNIAGNHVCHDEFFEGYVCRANTGGFIFYKDHHWTFFDKESYNMQLSSDSVHCAYEQALVVREDTIFRPYLMKPQRKETWRVLAENQQGMLMVVTSRGSITFEQFANALVQELHVRNALYMDMGCGWNYSWFQNADGSLTYFFPMGKTTQYQTNWLVFK